MTNNALIDENLDYRYDITNSAYEQAKGMASNWESQYQEEIAILKKALELACKKICENCKGIISWEIDGFKNKAKEIINESKS